MINLDVMDIAGILLHFYVNTIPHPRVMARVRAIPGDLANGQSPKFDTKNETESDSD